MTRFQLWGPHARTVHLRLEDELHPMQPCERQPGGGGWWSADIADVPAGADYAFVLDGGEPLPDPRSPWQPQGVLGPSRLVDHGSFAWSDGGWQAPPLTSAVIYELHVGTFSPEGTFAGVATCLDHLVDLGITHVELMPVQEFSGDWGWGYDGADLYAPHHAYGGPEELKKLVNACHQRGLAVLLDVVYNHLGPVGNYLFRFGPYFSDRYHTPWGAAVNLDGPGSGNVRRFLCDNALMWLRDYHFDGLRLDAVHAIFDASALHFLEQLASEVAELGAQTGRHFVLIAESDLNNPRLVTSTEAGGYGLDAQWSDDFHHALHAVLTGERSGYYSDFGGLADLAKALESAFVYDGQFSRYRGRVHGSPARHLPGWRFLGYLQTHDQVGNRAAGARSGQLMSFGRLKIGGALVLCSPFIPMLFQGEEFGASTPFQYFTHHSDLAVAHAVSVGRKQEFQAFGWNPDGVPDPQDPQTFLRSKIEWGEIASEPHASILDWHRGLIALRRSAPELSDGRLGAVSTQFDEEQQWLLVERGSVAVAVNLAPVPQTVEIPFGSRILMSSDPANSLAVGAVQLAPDSVAILQGAK